MKLPGFGGEAVPDTMRALELRAYDGRPESLALAERPVPRPGPGEVLVRISASPVNPSDLMFVRGLYGLTKDLPVVPGFEASGKVVAAGDGLAAKALLGRRVACGAPERGDGTWAEYMVASANMCFPLLPHVGDEEGAMMIVNPLTAWALLGLAVSGGHKAAAQTAAASALGKMLVRLARRRDYPLVSIVRRAEQAEALRAEGAEHVLDTSEPDYDAQAARLFRRLGVTVAFDAIAGASSGALAAAMPRGGKVVVYGGLSEQPCAIAPGELIFGGKTLEGFWLSSWIKARSLLQVGAAGVRVQNLLRTDFRSAVRARLSLEEAHKGLADYAARMTEGKVLFTPAKRPA